MVTGFLNDLNLKDAPDDPNLWPVGKHPAVLTAIKIQDAKEGEENPHRAVIFTYKGDTSDPDVSGKTKTEFKTVPNMAPKTDPITGESKMMPATPEDDKHAAYLKQRIKSFGVPESAMDELQIEDLTGTPVTVTIAQRGDYRNIVGVELREEASVGALSSMI